MRPAQNGTQKDDWTMPYTAFMLTKDESVVCRKPFPNVLYTSRTHETRTECPVGDICKH